jgi:NAD(P)-dependent dehydrogenase (short-subunit alcohol dehydrogenase family)
VATTIGSSSPDLDLLINAVGMSDRGTALKLSPERIEELMRANVYGPLRVVQALRSQLHSGSVIVNIGSLSSHFAPRHLGGYSIAKHGLRALTQQLRLELREHGIHVMLACPGPITRADTGSRYASLASAGDVPAEALRGGGGAKLKGLDPGQLSRDILKAAAARRLALIRPRKARWLIWLVALCPSWGEWILRRMTS